MSLKWNHDLAFPKQNEYLVFLVNFQSLQPVKPGRQMRLGQELIKQEKPTEIESSMNPAHVTGYQAIITFLSIIT